MSFNYFVIVSLFLLVLVVRVHPFIVVRLITPPVCLSGVTTGCYQVIDSSVTDQIRLITVCVAAIQRLGFNKPCNTIRFSAHKLILMKNEIPQL